MERADPDIELTRLAQAGDMRAFEALVVKYQRRIARHVARFIKSADDVEDVVQEVFVRAYRGLPSFRGDSLFYSWLYRIASNTALNHLRRMSPEVPLGDDSPDEAAGEFVPGLSDAAQPDRTLMAEQSPTRSSALSRSYSPSWPKRCYCLKLKTNRTRKSPRCCRSRSAPCALAFSAHGISSQNV